MDDAVFYKCQMVCGLEDDGSCKTPLHFVAHGQITSAFFGRASLPSAFEYSIPFPEQEGRLASELLLHGLDEVDVGEDVLLLLDVLGTRTLDGFGGGSGCIFVIVFLLILFLRAAFVKKGE